MVLNLILSLLFLPFSQSENRTDCLSELYKVIRGASESFAFSPPHYGKMFQYSGKAVNQLGVFQSCWEMTGAEYVLIEFNRHPPILYSICGPSVCSESDWEYIVNSWINSTTSLLPNKAHAKLGKSSANTEEKPFKVHFPENYIQDRFHDLNGPAVAMIVISVLIGMLCIVGSAVDLFTKQSEEEIKLDVEQTGITKDDYLSVPASDSMLKNILICFSIVRNMKKLMSQHLDDYHPHLYYFDGIRVVTIGWVILGACGDYYFNEVPLINFEKLDSISKQYYALPSYSALMALDVLYWIGGFLYAYFMLNSFTFAPKHWLVIYLKHYLEMAPLFVFVTFFFWTLARFMGFGPWFFTGNNIYDDCKDYWWTNMFFISNIVPNGSWSQCLSTGWFLSVEMQLFVFTPPLIMIYKKVPFLAWIIVGVLMGVSMLLAGTIAHHFDLNASIAYADSRWTFYAYYFNKPYIRMPPYLFGILSGFIYFASLNNSEDGIANLFVKLFKNFVYRYLNLAFGVVLWLILINVQFQVYEHPGSSFKYDEWSHDKTSAYFAFLRFGLGLSYTCMFTAMSLGFFPWISAFFSSQFWTPWSRLTFTVYLIHLPIIDIAMRSLQFSKYFNKTFIFMEFITMTVICYFVAVIFALFIDIPVKTFILMIFGKKGVREDYYEIND